MPDTLIGKRDRALLLLGFAAALRRSELVGLVVADLERTESGLIVHIRRSKTDQEQEGQQVPVPRGLKLKPVEAIDTWLAAAAIADGPLFRPIAKGGRVLGEALTDRSVADIVKRCAQAAGLDPEIFSGHSLRACFVTSALESGADVLKVMDVTRHRDSPSLRSSAQYEVAKRPRHSRIFAPRREAATAGRIGQFRILLTQPIPGSSLCARG